MRRRRERGAVMLEVAMVVPLLTTLVLGVAELGLHVRDTQSITAATQAGARVVSSSGNSRLSDYDALMTMAAPLSAFDVAAIERIIVFVPTIDGELPTACKNGSIPDVCNHYDGTDLALTPSSFTGTTNCGVFDPDWFWCPLDRETDQGMGTDWIGVRVEIRHESVAPFLPDRTISDTTVMRVEPRFEP